MIPIEYLTKPTVTSDQREAMSVDSAPNWMTPIYDYLAQGTSPPDVEASHQLQNQAGWYIIINKHLYKRVFSLPYLQCITPKEAFNIQDHGCQGHSPRLLLAFLKD
ncbi:hypothetical protein PRUPE_6G166700 [Prunus persica]|uniref:Uncharacterized protein n=1 Tax=Prunus persica TaxID=3760 RepID=A0A251NRH5_PRUPE|nr:hypothetical protein PRUPE_6G166700 [Prunus persica]